MALMHPLPWLPSTESNGIATTTHPPTPQIFCTEPYRVPMAGKVDVCLFDKTGTLTTDELVAVGVEGPTPFRGEGSSGRERGGDRSSLTDTLVTMREAPAAATLVLAGCQSLVLMEGSEAGDPVEAASMKAIKVGDKVTPHHTTS